MIETAENLAEKYGIGREEADSFAARSQQNAAAATESGKFADEIVPVEVPVRRGDPVVLDRDEGIRPETTEQTLATLRPIMPGGTVTAGNSAQQNDAAAACLVVAEDQLDRLGLTPLAWFEGWAAVGCEPATMGIGPVGAVNKLFGRTGVGFDDLALIEINEAFAVQVLAVLREWGLPSGEVADRLNVNGFAAQVLACTAALGLGDNDFDRINVNGSGISLGHPVGATGVRILATMLRELDRRGGGLALETMCIGGGQGIAALFRGASA